MTKTREILEANDVVEPLNQTGTEANGVTRRSKQRGQTFYRQAVKWLQSGPSHETCRHEHSCVFYVLKVRIYALTHVRLSNFPCCLRPLPLPPPPHSKYWKSSFNFNFVRLCDLDNPRGKWLNCLQTLISLHILGHLIWVCAGCQVPFWRSPD